MNDLMSLVKRNTLAFLRDKAAVFFSFLSVIILLALYFLFIGKQYTSDLTMVSNDMKIFLSVGVIMGGVLVINTVSLSLGVMGNIITDLQFKRLDAFLVTPVKRYKIILSYYITSIIVTVVLTLVMWFLTVLYVGIFSGYWYTFLTIIKVSGLLIFYTFISATLMIFLTTILKSVNAFGALSGVLGTFIGFISGIYMPLFVLGKSMVYVASLVPFTHMTILLKQVLLKEPYALLPGEMVDEISGFYGTNEVGVLGQDVNLFWILLVSLLLSFLLLYFAYRNMSRKMTK
ncbi:MAG TPA: ABC transporter permease [Acholeplasmataceae bacterium]|jgi:multidrug/hemolysin transport system permease protein|nr:ABC transporter permease [Acholeplasmataceae bacterium]